MPFSVLYKLIGLYWLMPFCPYYINHFVLQFITLLIIIVLLPVCIVFDDFPILLYTLLLIWVFSHFLAFPYCTNLQDFLALPQCFHYYTGLYPIPVLQFITLYKCQVFCPLSLLSHLYGFIGHLWGMQLFKVLSALLWLYEGQPFKVLHALKWLF